MKVVLYMAMTVNGYIAKESDDTSFVSKREWQIFSKVVRRFGNMIIGARTHEIMHKGNEFKDFREVQIVVVAKNYFRCGHQIAKSPKQAVGFIHKKGFKNIIVAGGGVLNSSFMKENLIDEIYLDVEPTVFGKGIKLFADADFEAKLKLVGIKKLSKDEAQMQYKILK